MNDSIITRSFVVPEFRTVDEGGKVSGYPIVFGQKVNIGGLFYEIIDRDALAGADLTDVLFFVNHDEQKIPLARSRRNNGNSTMTLRVEEQGLNFDANLDIDNNNEARALYSSIKRGDIDGMSFKFRISDQKWEDLDTKMPTRTILKIGKVFEISAVNNPAYSNTSISARGGTLESEKSALDNARAAMMVDTIKIERERALAEIEMMKRRQGNEH